MSLKVKVCSPPYYFNPSTIFLKVSWSASYSLILSIRILIFERKSAFWFSSPKLSEGKFRSINLFLLKILYSLSITSYSLSSLTLASTSLMLKGAIIEAARAFSHLAASLAIELSGCYFWYWLNSTNLKFSYLLYEALSRSCCKLGW